MKRENVLALLHALAGVGAVSVGLFTGPDLPLPRDAARLLGGLVFGLGMAAFVWAVIHLRGTFFGNVEPRSNRLIHSGPYRWVRHPLYLGMVVSTLGLVVGLRSLWGVIGTLLVFVPLGMYRARLEERALARAFGRAWDDYASRTYFVLPPLW